MDEKNINEKEVGAIIEIYNQIDDLYEEIGKGRKRFNPSNICYDCTRLTDMLLAIKSQAPSFWCQKLCIDPDYEDCGESIEFPECYKAIIEFPEVGDIDNIRLALRIIGQIMDINHGPKDEEFTLTDNPWEKFLTSLRKSDNPWQKLITSFGKSDQPPGQAADLGLLHLLDDEYGKWMEDNIERFEEFYRNLEEALYHLIHNLIRQFRLIDPVKYPSLWLLIVRIGMKENKLNFMKSMIAVGPYFPSSTGIWKEPVNTYENDERPGTLEIEYAMNSASCTFWRSEQEPVVWKFDSCEYEDFTDRFTLNDYAYWLFNTWNYLTGEYLYSGETDQIATWLRLNTVIHPLYELQETTDSTVRAALALSLHNDYKDLAEKIIAVVSNNRPKWQPGRVEWSYVKELDAVTFEVRKAEELYALQHNNLKYFPTTKTNTTRSRLSFNRIPPERQSLEVTLVRAANAIGCSEKTVLRRIERGQYIAKKVGCHWVFDLKTLPGPAWAKLKN